MGSIIYDNIGGFGMVCGKEATTPYKLRATSDEEFFREHVITI